GKPTKTVVFHWVLYVPELQNNLFSVLHAVRKGGLKVTIERTEIIFSKVGQQLIMGSI
ncbi:hypothetical protein K439DRAFT_1262135, partial [Ramaria rubella]